VPSSPAGSLFSTDCSCSTSGGFEGHANGLIGCKPCNSGWASAIGDEKCSICASGTYSSTSEVLDLYKCPTLESPSIYFITESVPSPIDNGDCNIYTTIGSSQCTQCPVHLPHTRSDGSTTIDDCVKCGDGTFFDAVTNLCQECTPVCDSSTSFEQVSCTALYNRVCWFCDRSSCGIGDYISDCPGDYASIGKPEKGCKKCISKPANSSFVETKIPGSGPNTCTWACDQGFYSTAGIFKCNSCTLFNATTCPAGMLFNPCNSILQKDSSCLLECVSPDKPLINSEWLKAVFNYRTGLPILNDDPYLPNTSCMWKCISGYTKTTTSTGIVICSPNPVNVFETIPG
jgi:hypothetical protein